MDLIPEKYFEAYVKAEILERKWWRYYLAPPWDRFGKLKDIIDIPLDKKFIEVSVKYMNAYIKDGKMPPAEIAPAIFNMLDDYVNGSEKIAIRTGDYIAMQNFLRGKKSAE